MPPPRTESQRTLPSAHGFVLSRLARDSGAAQLQAIGAPSHQPGAPISTYQPGLSVDHSHCLANLVERLLGNHVRTGVAVMQHVLDIVKILLVLVTTLANRRKVPIDSLGDHLLELPSASVANLLGKFFGIPTKADAGSRQQGRDTWPVIRIKGDEPLGVRPRLLDQLGRLLFGHADGDGVSIALAHLSPIEARYERRRGQQAGNVGEHLSVSIIEATGDLCRNLDVGQLVTTDWNDVSLAEEDVACLVDGIGQQEAGQ